MTLEDIKVSIKITFIIIARAELFKIHILCRASVPLKIVILGSKFEHSLCFFNINPFADAHFRIYGYITIQTVIDMNGGYYSLNAHIR